MTNVMHVDGQTGSGKTFTIGGGEIRENSSDYGIIQRIITDMFARIQSSSANGPNFQAVVEMSYMEVVPYRVYYTCPLYIRCLCRCTRRTVMTY